MPKLLDNDIADAETIGGETLDGQAENISDMQNDIDAELQDVLAAIDEDPKDVKIQIRVKQIEKNTGKAWHLFNALPSELPLTDRITEEYGGGTYEIWVYKNNYRHKKSILRIKEKLKKPVDKMIAETKGDIAGLMATMMEQQRQSMEQMQKLILQASQNNQPAASASDPVQMMTAMMGAMVQMKEFIQPQQNGSQIDGLIKGIELAKELAGGNGEKNINDTIVSLAKEFAPPLLSMAAREQQNPRPLPQPAKPGQQVAPQNPPPTGTQTMTPDEQRAFNEFKSKVDFLVIKASHNTDPGFVADMVLELVHPDQLKPFLTRHDAMDYLAQFNPEVMNYRPWFESLKAELQTNLAEPELTEDPNHAIPPESEINSGTDIDAIAGDSAVTENP